MWQQLLLESFCIASNVPKFSTLENLDDNHGNSWKETFVES